MKEIIIDATKMQTAEKIHEFLLKELEFPDWYGKNLDALFDCLTESPEELHLILKESKTLPRGFLKVFYTAAKENPKILIFEQ